MSTPARSKRLFTDIRRFMKWRSLEYLEWGEFAMAGVVLEPGKALSVDELIAHCRRSLANYKIPRRVEFLETELPKSGVSKILKRILRDRFWAHHERA